MSTPYPWYEVTSDPCQQGDFLRNCLTPVLPREKDESPEKTTALRFDTVIVMTQSCDLLNKDITQVQVCPVWALDQFLAEVPKEQRKNRQEQLRKGRLVAFHLLNRCVLHDFDRPHMVVDLAAVFSIPREYVLALTKTPRLRLLPPYREQLAQSFAKLYMRVGLPVEVDPLPG